MSTELTSLTSETLADQAYTRLRGAIDNGELAAGQRITERGLATQLQVSPTPVREAIRRLEQDGLVERLGPRTMRIATLSDATTAEVVEAEIALRGVVARFAARNATAGQLAELEELLDRADEHIRQISRSTSLSSEMRGLARELLEVMRTFNEVVERASGNPVLMRLLDQARAFTPREQADITLDRMLNGSFRGSERYGYHRDLVAAIRARDAARAEELTLTHSAEVRRELPGRSS